MDALNNAAAPLPLAALVAALLLAIGVARRRQNEPDDIPNASGGLPLLGHALAYDAEWWRLADARWSCDGHMRASRRASIPTPQKPSKTVLVSSSSAAAGTRTTRLPFSTRSARPWATSSA